MKNLQAYGIVMALAASLGGPLAAQGVTAPAAEESGFSADLKLHYAYTPQNRDHLHYDYQIIGVDFGLQTGLGRVGAEVGWLYKTGDGFVAPLPANPTNGKAPISRGFSGDARRNDLNGLLLRLSLSRPFLGGWTWQAGLQIGGTQWNQQYFGDTTGNYVASNPARWDWRDLYNGNLKGSYKGLSPYAGVKTEIGHNGALEFNLVVLNYQTKNYVHYAGTAGGGYKTFKNSSNVNVYNVSEQNDFPLDTFVTRKRYVPHFEIAYVYHF